MQIGLHDVGAPGKKLVESSIWEWRGPTQDEGDEASAWLTKYLGKNVRLVRLLSGAPPLHTVPFYPCYVQSCMSIMGHIAAQVR